MTTAAALGLAGTGLAVMGSPGPSTLSLVAVVSVHGFRAAAGYCLGLVTGTTLVLLAVATGVTALLLALPLLHWVLLVVAAGYLLRLAVRLARSSGVGGDGTAGRRPSVLGGLVLGVLNPKAWVAIGAVFLAAHLAVDPVLDATVKVAVLTCVIIAVHLGWMAAGRLLAPVLRSPRRARAVNVSLAGLLVLAVVPLLVP
jgi:threonine/homoserine/homoserine lactone efflux protein